MPVAWTEHHGAFEPDTLAGDIGAACWRPARPAFRSSRCRLASPSPRGAQLRLVGFGRSEALARDEGTRRQGRAVVDAIDDLTLRYRPSPSQACIGDLGGPAFATNGSSAWSG